MASAPLFTLPGFPQKVTQRREVEWAQMDAYSHVNNKVHATWLEISRLHYFETLGRPTSLNEAGDGSMLAEINIRYRHPVTYPDFIHMHIRTKKIGNSAIYLEQRLTSEKNGHQVVAEADARIVFFNFKENKRQRIPDSFAAKVEELEGKKFPRDSSAEAKL